MERLGTGIGWRPEIADAVEGMPGIDWVEVVAENVCPGHPPASLRRLRERGVTVVPHGVSLGLGGAERPDEGRLRALAERAEALGSPLVTEHIAFVRAGGPPTASERIEAGHLLPVPRTREALDVLCENVRIAQRALPVPLAVENIAALLAWPGEELTEGQFLYELADRTGVRLLIDVANLYTNHVNQGEDPARALAELPLEALAYVHVAGGFERDGVWHDSHAHPVPGPVLDILTDLASRVSPPGVLLERDENFPEADTLGGELEAIRKAVARGRAGAAERAIVAASGGASTTPRRPAVVGGTGLAGSRGHLSGGPDGSQEHAEGSQEHARGSAEGSQEYARESADRSQEHARGSADGWGGEPAAAVAEPVRQRLALAQTALLSALVAGTPAPEGFDRKRLAVQARALASKRAGVVAKVAPELPVILGSGYRAAFLAYAQEHPMRGGYRLDALTFAESLLLAGQPQEAGARRDLREWWLERSGPAPRSRRPVVRAARAARRMLLRR
ncbi:DUF692 domain-containing protein [Streptomyces sp. NPDC006743]|uniref:DUF692 domain-containing protein n=1 Tax=Streptomyces sp. NPDC006743 TaxID=3154480 RepID=UPI003456A678